MINGYATGSQKPSQIMRADDHSIARRAKASGSSLSAPEKVIV
jgi:hypothetical protein